MSPHRGKGKRHPSHWINSGKRKGMGGGNWLDEELPLLTTLQVHAESTRKNASNEEHMEFQRICIGKKPLTTKERWLSFNVNSVRLHLTLLITASLIGGWVPETSRSFYYWQQAPRWRLLLWLANPDNPAMSPHAQPEDLRAKCNQLGQMGLMETAGHGPKKNCSTRRHQMSAGSEKLWASYRLWNSFRYWEDAIHGCAHIQ